MSSVTDIANVQVPVHTAYNQWTQFEEFPNFIEGMKQVTQIDHREFDTQIVDQFPDERKRGGETGAWRGRIPPL
ncbi:hypothetical protein DVK44_15735 [Streptomyces paludis]|uniref:Coenzyme Q-binding protein COQ10 START domain-containing protein n=1 Tax=Streptomyces paludis TaxID=2282738 RepID=A0A345HQD8_9ACTN|nr:hypothetical protein DVK44_15735 [Streptomyces paludis]